MIYDCDPADTISALRAANEDLAMQVRHWKGIANKPDETLEFQLREARSDLELACAEINRLNGVIEKYRAVSAPVSDQPDYESAARALGFIRTPTGNWIHPKDDFTLRRHYTSAEEIFNRELPESGS